MASPLTDMSCQLLLWISNVISSFLEILFEVEDHHEQNKNGEEDVQNLDKLILHDLIGNEEDGGNACVSDNQK